MITSSYLTHTPAGLPVQPAYGPADRQADPPPPGTFPFTRGNFAAGYRGRLWTLRQYSGFGTPEESNSRYRYLLEQGGTGLSVALDLPTTASSAAWPPSGRSATPPPSATAWPPSPGPRRAPPT
jgi:methylmalonyl-CoA mutase N-terminal domain/subunit